MQRILRRCFSACLFGFSLLSAFLASAAESDYVLNSFVINNGIAALGLPNRAYPSIVVSHGWQPLSSFVSGSSNSFLADSVLQLNGLGEPIFTRQNESSITTSYPLSDLAAAVVSRSATASASINVFLYSWAGAYTIFQPAALQAATAAGTILGDRLISVLGKRSTSGVIALAGEIV